MLKKVAVDVQQFLKRQQQQPGPLIWSLLLVDGFSVFLLRGKFEKSHPRDILPFYLAIEGQLLC